MSKINVRYGSRVFFRLYRVGRWWLGWGAPNQLWNTQIYIKLDPYHNLSDIILYFFIIVYCECVKVLCEF